MGGVWEPKILDFRTFFDVFSMSFFKRASEGEKIDQNEPTRHRKRKFGPGSDDPLVPGERQREGYKIFALHKELDSSDLPSVIGQDVSDSEFETSSARPWHTFGGRRIETPRGGPPPPTHLWDYGDLVR